LNELNLFYLKLKFYFFNNKNLYSRKIFNIFLGIGDWGLGIGDWGLGIGDSAQSPIPNPQSPIPNPHFSHINFMNVFIN